MLPNSHKALLGFGIMCTTQMYYCPSHSKEMEFYLHKKISQNNSLALVITHTKNTGSWIKKEEWQIEGKEGLEGEWKEKKWGRMSGDAIEILLSIHIPEHTIFLSHKERKFRCSNVKRFSQCHIPTASKFRLPHFIVYAFSTMPCCLFSNGVDKIKTQELP